VMTGVRSFMGISRFRWDLELLTKSRGKRVSHCRKELHMEEAVKRCYTQAKSRRTIHMSAKNCNWFLPTTAAGMRRIRRQSLSRQI
jgi:hypothetical protein